MPEIIDITGQRFGHWTVIERSYRSLGRHTTWRCRCDCGTEVIVVGKSLRRGLSISCGCQRPLACSIANTTHGHSAGRKLTDTYRSWRNMKTRCLNPNASRHKDYGERGITVCKRWLGPNGFENFLADMGERPRGRSLDRIDNDKGYRPSNCRWATPLQQNRNRRKRRG